MSLQSYSHGRDRRSQQTEQGESIEHKLSIKTHKNGQQVTLESSAVPLFSDQEQTAGVRDASSHQEQLSGHRWLASQQPDEHERRSRGNGQQGHHADQFHRPHTWLARRQEAVVVRDHSRHLGALGYLVKPIDAEQIVPAIEAALKRARETKKLQESKSRLANALENDQITSTAVGVVMERHHLTRDEAFEKLRNCARSQRRKLAEVSSNLVKAIETANIR